VIAIVILGYLGFIPILSDLMGSTKPRDLGIKYTQADYDSAGLKNRVKIIVVDSAPTIETSMICSGSRNIEASFTQEELTARINMNSQNWKYFPVKNIQIKINQDGTAESSGLLMIDNLQGFAKATSFGDIDMQKVLSKLKFVRKEIPFYVKFAPTVRDGQVTMAVEKAEMGRLAMPQDFSEKYKNEINYYASRLISTAAFPGLYVSSMNLDGGQMNFKGRLPESITTAKEIVTN
jgi:hypothetical protein